MTTLKKYVDRLVGDSAELKFLKEWLQTHDMTFIAANHGEWQYICRMFGFESKKSCVQSYGGATYYCLTHRPTDDDALAAVATVNTYHSSTHCAYHLVGTRQSEFILLDKSTPRVKERIGMILHHHVIAQQTATICRLTKELKKLNDENKRCERVVYDGAIDRYFIMRGDGTVSWSACKNPHLQRLLQERKTLKRKYKLCRDHLAKVYADVCEAQEKSLSGHPVIHTVDDDDVSSPPAKRPRG